MQRTTIEIARSSGLLASWVLTVCLGMFAALFVTPLFVLFIPEDMARGASLGKVLIDHWISVALAAVSTFCALWALVSAIRDTRRARTHREVVVGDDGIELVSHPRWWYRGRRTMVRWDDVEVVSARRVLISEAAGKHTRRVAREGLDLYLARPATDVPEFATLKTLEESPLEGVSVPAHRLRIAGPGNTFAATVRRLTSAVGDARPDLFYRGTAVDQWFTPDLPPNAPAPLPQPHTPEYPTPAPPTAVPPHAARASRPAEFALPTPLWLDYNYRSGCTLIGLVLSIGTSATAYLASVYLNEREGGVLLVLLGILCVLLLAAGVIFTLIGLVYLPRALVRTGILIDSEGVEVVEKRRWGIGQVRERIPWHNVQAIVFRESTLVRLSAAADKTENPAIDLYLHGDTGFTKPGAGVAMRLTHLPRADSTATQVLVEFPALRVRLPHFAEPDADTDTALWCDLPTEGPGPLRLPGSQLRAALYAARPDLCHGFTDANHDSEGKT